MISSGHSDAAAASIGQSRCSVSSWSLSVPGMEMPLREWVWARPPQRLVIPMTEFHDKRKAWPSSFAQLSFLNFFFLVSVFQALFQVISWMKPHLSEQEGCFCLDGRVKNMAVAGSSSAEQGHVYGPVGQIHKNSKKHFSKIKTRTEDCLKGVEGTLKLFWTKQRK